MYVERSPWKHMVAKRSTTSKCIMATMVRITIKKFSAKPEARYLKLIYCGGVERNLNDDI